MTPAQGGRRRRLRLLAAGVILDLLGAALLLFGGRGYLAWALALIAAVVGIRLIGKAQEARRREAAVLPSVEEQTAGGGKAAGT